MFILGDITSVSDTPNNFPALAGSAAGPKYILAAGNIAANGTTDPITGVVGGSYILAAMAAAWNGATLKLQVLGPDGVTFQDVTGASFTSNGDPKGVVIGSNATVRLMATGGAPTGVNSSLT